MWSDLQIVTLGYHCRMYVWNVSPSGLKLSIHRGSWTPGLQTARCLVIQRPFVCADVDGCTTHSCDIGCTNGAQVVAGCCVFIVRVQLSWWVVSLHRLGGVRCACACCETQHFIAIAVAIPSSELLECASKIVSFLHQVCESFLCKNSVSLFCKICLWCDIEFGNGKDNWIS